MLVGVKRDVIVEESFKILNGTQKQSAGMPLWDGKIAERIVDVFSVVLIKIPKVEKVCIGYGSNDL